MSIYHLVQDESQVDPEDPESQPIVIVDKNYDVLADLDLAETAVQASNANTFTNINTFAANQNFNSGITLGSYGKIGDNHNASYGYGVYLTAKTANEPDMYLNFNNTGSSTAELRPSLTDAVNLGTSTKQFENLYLHGLLSDGTDSVYVSQIADIATNGIKANSDTVFTGNNTFSQPIKVRDPYHSTSTTGPQIATYNNESISLQVVDSNNISRGITVTGTTAFSQVAPYITDTMNLGSSSFKFKDLYLSGNLSDGTNTVSIADLAALITYAKTQGWIQ